MKLTLSYYITYYIKVINDTETCGNGRWQETTDPLQARDLFIMVTSFLDLSPSLVSRFTSTLFQRVIDKPGSVFQQLSGDPTAL